MKRFYKLIERLYDKKIDASGLAVFRILFGFILFGEVLQLYNFRHLMFDKIPFLVHADFDHSYLLITWMIALVFLILGLFTKYVTIANYVFSVYFFGSTEEYEYHMFHVYMAVNFLLIFMGVSREWSLDQLHKKLKYSNTQRIYKPDTRVTVLSYYIVVFAAIGMVYFDSVFYKYNAQLWRDGLGVWLPSSVPPIVHNDTSAILNIKWLCVFLSYLTLIFETVFIFLFFRKRWRIPLMIIGIGLHVGIFIEYPIPWFASGYVFMYFLMIPVGFWRKLKAILTFKNPWVTFFYDEECPLCVRTKIILSHFNVFGAIQFTGLQSGGFNDKRLSGIKQEELLLNIHASLSNGKVYTGLKAYIAAFFVIPFFIPLAMLLCIPGIYHLGKRVYGYVAATRIVERCTEDSCGYTPPPIPVDVDQIKLTKSISIKKLKLGLIVSGFVIMGVLQANSTYNSDLINSLKDRMGIRKSKFELSFQKISKPCRKFSKVMFGVTGHNVFLNKHFEGYNHVLALEYIPSNGGPARWLPITTKTGQPDWYQVGPTWAKWGFRINRPKMNDEALYSGIRDFTAFWMGESGVSYKNARFKVWVKVLDTPTQWEYNFLRNQMAKPWQEAGYAIWQDEQFSLEIQDIEQMK
jgi:predicted DCC family thiol-disulfide oxidoreductase YuxK